MEKFRGTTLRKNISFFISFLACVGGSVLATESLPNQGKEESDSSLLKKVHFGTMHGLPSPGTIVKKLRVPQYSGTRISAYVTGESLKVLDESCVTGKKIEAFLYRGTESVPMHLILMDAQFNLASSMLVTKDALTIEESRYYLQGTGALIDVQNKKGYVYGPVSTQLKFTPKAKK